MVIKVDNLAEARKMLAAFEKQVSELEEKLVEADKQNMVMSATVNLMNNAGTYDGLLAEVKKLKRREMDLLRCNNEEVERRRKISDEFRRYKTANDLLENPLLKAHAKIERELTKLKAKK